MKVWRFPLSKIILSFIGGILAADRFPFDLRVHFFLLPLAVVTFALSFYLARTWRAFQFAFTFSALALAFVIGMATLTFQNADYEHRHYSHLVNSEKKNDKIEAILKEKLKSTPKANRYIGEVLKVNGRRCNGKVLLYLKKPGLEQSFPIGLHVRITGRITKPAKPTNPGQFDYRNYMRHQSVFGQMYVERRQLEISEAFDKDVFYYADKLRSRILKNLIHSGFGEKELAVAAALILGQQQEIAPDILHDYQFAGAIHILSVSGLHVGFILMFLNLLLDYLPKKRPFSWIKLIIIWLSLWGFAVLAGLSPSVIRSVTMFSFVALGMHLQRKTNIFHTLLISVFLILLLAPSFLFDVGFQLSYAALFFIVWLQPLLGNLWSPKYKVVQYFWNILTVSFAAQLGTFPLSVYYFHQFPGLFFVTNLVVIPFLSVIMALGVGVMLLAASSHVPHVLCAALEWSIKILNGVINRIAAVEQLVFKDIPFNAFLLLSLYLMLLAFVMFWERQIFKRLVFLLVAVLSVQASYFGSKWANRNTNEWIVFNVRKSTLIAKKQGEAVTVYGDSKTDSDYFLKPYLVANFSDIKSVLPLRRTDYFNSKKILLLDNPNCNTGNQSPDILLLRKCPKLNLERWLQQNRPKTIVADASNYRSYVDRWKATCAKEKIPFHATAEKGFYKLK